MAEDLVTMTVALNVLRAGAARKQTPAARADSLQCMCDFFLRLELMKAGQPLTPATLANTRALLKASLPLVSTLSGMMPTWTLSLAGQ